MTGIKIHSLKAEASFAEVHKEMLGLLQLRIEDQIEDTLMIVEHKPVITRGRGLQWREDRVERAKPLIQIPEGTDYVEIERGGDLTWHGPGQLVLYPIIKLGGEGVFGKRIGQDVDGYIRFLETLWIETLRPMGLECISKPGGSGVWLGDRKLASVGIALRRWVTYHGIAMNIVNPIEPFMAFSPCGFNAEVMSRLSDQAELGREWFDGSWRDRWEGACLATLERMRLSRV